MRNLPPHVQLLKQITDDFVPMSLKELVHISRRWIRRQCSLLKCMSNRRSDLRRCCFSLTCCTLGAIVVDVRRSLASLTTATAEASVSANFTDSVIVKTCLLCP